MTWLPPSTPTMSLVQLLIVASIAYTQSFAQDIASGDFRSNTCLRRSVYVYTQSSDTYVVTDLGSTSFAASPSFCPNASISTTTVYRSNETIPTALPASTITITEQAAPSLTSVAPATQSAVTDNGFEQGNAAPFNSSASSPQVSAQVAQAGQGVPLRPFGGNSYLYVLGFCRVQS